MPSTVCSITAARLTMRPPDFWQRDGTLPRLLEPLGRLYGLGARVRPALVRPWRAPVPVICVGNLTVGGTGKTPLVLALARFLIGRGRKPHLLSRGYGARARGPLRVEPDRHDAAAVGDEPLLLAEVAPTWIARDRRAAARAATAAGADVLVMDDGYQNPALFKDLPLLVIDGGTGFGNGRLLPAGPLREAPAAGLARAAAAVVVGRDRSGIGARLPEGLTRVTAELRPTAEARRLAGKRVLAVAGIGRPAKFFETLEELGAEVVARYSFADHRKWRAGELLALLGQAGELRAIAVTTTKDLARMPRDLRVRFRAVPVELVPEDPDALERLLAPLLPGRAVIET